MSIEARKGRMGTTYRIQFTDATGKRVKESAGKDKREAERLLAQREREVRAGTYRREGQTAATRVRTFAREWLGRRDARNALNDVSSMERFILSRKWLADMPIGLLRPMHSAQLIAELRNTPGATGTQLSDKTIKNVFALFRTMCREAQMRELIACDPCVIARSTFRRKVGPSKRTIYPRPDLLALCTDDRSAPVMRVFAALAFGTGARKGELCGLRWGDLDKEPKPLAALRIERQYEGGMLKTDRTHGEHARLVPVHPDLLAILDAWRTGGYELHCGKRPTEDSPIIPTRDGRHHSRTSIYLAWVTACERVGVEQRSVHSTRHTFVTMARRDGAGRDILEKLTHNAKGEVIDGYTHWEWAPLCEAVERLKWGVGAALGTASVTPRVTPSEPEGLDLQFRRRDSNSGKRADNLGQLAPSSKNTEQTTPYNFPVKTPQAAKRPAWVSRPSASKGERRESLADPAPWVSASADWLTARRVQAVGGLA